MKEEEEEEEERGHGCKSRINFCTYLKKKRIKTKHKDAVMNANVGPVLKPAKCVVR